MFFDRGTFGVLPLTYFYLPKSARVYLFPKSVKIHNFCSGPISVDPICPRPNVASRQQCHSCHILPFQPILRNRYFPPEPANTAPNLFQRGVECGEYECQGHAGAAEPLGDGDGGRTGTDNTVLLRRPLPIGSGVRVMRICQSKIFQHL